MHLAIHPVFLGILDLHISEHVVIETCSKKSLPSCASKVVQFISCTLSDIAFAVIVGRRQHFVYLRADSDGSCSS